MKRCLCVQSTALHCTLIYAVTTGLTTRCVCACVCIALYAVYRLCTTWMLISGTGQQMLVLTLKLLDHTTGIYYYNNTINVRLLQSLLLSHYLLLPLHIRHCTNAIEKLQVYAVKARSRQCCVHNHGLHYAVLTAQLNGMAAAHFALHI
jgi:hypothetical protein